MSIHEDPESEVSRGLYESPAETKAAIERIRGHFRSIRKAMAEEKTARRRGRAGFSATKTRLPD
jgi:hypothetical protein